jgi:hypothetical protein
MKTLHFQRIVFISLLLIIHSTVIAEYVPPKLYQMILKAERIIYGKIISIEEQTYVIQPIWSSDGQLRPVTIKKFEDWSCAQRWSKYGEGQLLFTFLVKRNGFLEGISPGDECEFPVFQDSVYIHSKTLIQPQYPPLPERKQQNPASAHAIPSRVHQLYGSPYKGFSCELQKFILTVKNIRECFHYRKTELRTRCEEDVLQRFALKDRVFRWTLYESRKQ